MARPTDEELEQLLRETFADKEKLVDTLPQATKGRRPLAPVLLAAAAVIVVLGGILYGVNRTRDVDPAPPVATAQAGDDAQIWASAITAITQRFQSDYQLSTLLVQAQTATIAVAGPESVPQRYAGPIQEFSGAEKDQIAQQVVRATRLQVEWVNAQAPAERDKCARELARISVGNVVDQGDHREVRTLITYNCGWMYTLTYRLEKRADAWTVTGTVGLGQGVIPAGGCPFSGKTPTTAEPGC
ncbi:hypothetical protein AB0L70_07980 [Kribbella sp. NPDC051952]|uniref:hypothetical protein n=1 Tax=Kribbella sp. NPDC051952 TaxID=3154851 RepID=UPI00341218C3